MAFLMSHEPHTLPYHLFEKTAQHVPFHNPAVSDAEGLRYCAMRTPERTHVGSGAVLSEHDSMRDAIAAAEDERVASGAAVLAGRLVAVMSWH